MEKGKTPRLPTIWEALIPVIFLMVVIIICTVKLEVEPHVPILLSAIVAAGIAMLCGHNWKSIITGILDSIGRATEALLIIMIVGILIGSWVWAGTMPAMVYYGLDLISPGAFLVVGATLTGIVGLATGSSWTASGTVGVALMGVAVGLGIDAPIAAGMVISGAYMGDKLSPLSDSTNIAAAGAETPLYDHVRAMMTTTVPSFSLALILYGIVGVIIVDSNEYDQTLALEIQNAIQSTFYISPWLISPVLIVIFAAIYRIPAIPSLLLAATGGILIAIFAQGASVGVMLEAIQYGYEADTGVEVADKLLNRGGFDSMMWTISLIMFALSFGGILEKCGFVEVLLGGLKKRVKRPGGLVAATIITGIACDVVLTDQYLAILVPGRMFAKTFDGMGLDRSFLSRTTEDGATLWSPMIPWNGCGAYQAATLGVSNWQFAPFAFMNLINPIYAIIITYLGIGIRYSDETKNKSYQKKAARKAKRAEKAK